MPNGCALSQSGQERELTAVVARHCLQGVKRGRHGVHRGRSEPPRHSPAAVGQDRPDGGVERRWGPTAREAE